MNRLNDQSLYDASTFAHEALSSSANLAATLDHTLLKPEATRWAGARVVPGSGGASVCMCDGESVLGGDGCGGSRGDRDSGRGP